jgi:hypothetical protein
MAYGELNKELPYSETLKDGSHAILYLPQTTIYAHVLGKLSDGIRVRELARSALTGTYEEGDAFLRTENILGHRVITKEEYDAAMKNEPFFAQYKGRHIILDCQTGPRGGLVSKLRHDGIILNPFLFANPADHKLEWRKDDAYVSQSLLATITPATEHDLDQLIVGHNKQIDARAEKKC